MNNTIDPKKFGVSFSVKQCRKFGVDPVRALDWLVQDAGFRRVRLMSYWNEHEKEQGRFDFAALDKQVEQVQKAGGVITMCLGARQPRYPEFHWPDWAWSASKEERDKALLNYVQVVVERYKGNPAIISWQLENEALLTSFGEKIEIDRKRLRQELAVVKQLDPSRPVIMSTSASWGVPIIGPIPDMSAFSFYLIRFHKGKYTTTYHAAWIHRLRALFIRIVWRKHSSIHELQMEPWGPKDIWEMTPEQQDESMGPKQIQKNFAAGKATHLYPLDLWGGEWWYWRLKTLNDPSTWEAVRQNLDTNAE
ncbi:MAG TPA: glycoside hydrolase family 2 TIM barrel-domain containing protein [Candidatus Limnocylindria bacterium]|nr:glycoside hydrolase family 2 TIM barrel-domain containing protein [Candidatus Limnocylindria bacterium]